jgi:hypothetical protein
MRNNHFYARHHKASFHTFHKSKLGLDDWMRSLRSIDQRPYDLFEIESLRQCIAPKVKFLESESDIEYCINGEGNIEEIRSEDE